MGTNRKQHEVIDIVLNRILVGDIMRHLQRPGTIRGIDVASCYNRMIHLVVILPARYEGMKQQMIYYNSNIIR